MSAQTAGTTGAGLAVTGGVLAATGVGAPVGIGMAAAGGLLSAYGAISSAQDQAALDAQKAAVANSNADELLSREAANEDLRNQQAYRAKLAFGSAFAGSGKAGTGIGSQLEIQRQTDMQNMVSNRDAQYQAQMLREQAGVDTSLGTETTQAGYLSAGSSILGGASAAIRAGSPSGNGGTQQITNNYYTSPGA